MKSIQDSGAWFGRNVYGTRFDQLDLLKQLAVLVDEFGTAHLHKNKITGDLNRKHRESIIFQFARDVHTRNLKLRNILNLKQKHISAAVECWKDEELAASTIQTRLSHLRWLTTAVGKRGFVKAAPFYGLAKTQVARTYVAQEDKSWSAKGINIDQKIEEARALDIHVGAQLDVMRHFGLRLTEAILFHPALADRGAHIDVLHGTKGGRPRTVLIRHPEQRAALERAKRVAAATERGSLVAPGKKPAQARNRFYYVARQIGITKAALGVTGHGLRHGYSNDLYEELAGVPTVVRGSSPLLDRARDEAVRRAVTQDLGHSRISITAAYTGPRVQGRPAKTVDEQQPAAAAFEGGPDVEPS